MTAPATPLTEQELLRGYRRGRDAEAVGTEVLARIHDLWAYHRWYKRHYGWLVESKVEHDAELRLLLRVARAGRRHPASAGQGYHEWQAR